MALERTQSSSAKNIEIQLFKDQTLGIGSYGKVCRARYGSLPCAAKLIHETLFDPEVLKLVEQEKKHRLPFKRFEQECEVLHNLRHPNVIQYLGVYQDPDTKLPVLLMELMDGSLTHFLEDSLQQIPFHIQVNLSHDIALALSFLHANKIIHRDLSSNNVLLISNVRAKVTDFGMATLGEHATLFSRTMCPGTDVYMPPEAVKEKPTYTEKIDCFSFGVLIIQILAQLFPDPGKRQETMDFSHRGRKVMMSVPEMERRQNHIDLVQPNHPLLVIALDCLNELESDRPSAQEICERVAALKESAEYADSMKEVGGEGELESSRDPEQGVDESLARDLREKEELIEAERQKNLKLQEVLAAKEKEIEELKKRSLTGDSAAKEQDATKQPSQSEKGWL
jgi:serine/threonine protein kinase